MRTATKVLLSSAAFSAVIGTIYWYVAYEIAGTIFLAAMAAALLLTAGWVARSARGPLSAQDRTDATPAESAGERIGPFPGASVWPACLGAASLLLVAGLIYGVWLLAIGGLIFAAAILGMAREGR